MVLAAMSFGVAIARGFEGISDDDAARTLIAWDFSHEPRLDPTRSSWLPVPFYLHGALLALTRELTWTPRLGSLVALVGCVLASYTLSRRLGASPLTSTVATALAALAPWSIYCGAAPGLAELYGCVFALAACLLLAPSREEPLPRALLREAGAGLLFALACLCRYELWFAAAGACLARTLGAHSARRRLSSLLFALFVALGPLAWIALNVRRTGDALDFVHRVVAFRAAHEASATGTALRYPAMLFASSGPFVLLALLGIRRRVALVASAALAALVGMVFVELRGGGATHHVERSLLPLVWLLAPACALALGSSRPALRLVARLLGVAALVWHVGRSWTVPREVSRDAIAAGRAVRALDRVGTCWAIELASNDALWVELASQHPERVRADRPFGAPAPRAVAWDVLARECTIAAVQSASLEATLRARGFAVETRAGAWIVLSHTR